ncbi:MAG: hypothetical protein SGJ13_01005 [Actinomycetota bacterium]|nr:hypothetical protein [Actinomycetota bacterium]
MDDDTAAQFPVEFTTDDMTFRTPEGWVEPEEQTAARDYQVESPDGRAVVWTSKFDADDALDTVVSFWLSNLNIEAGFPEEGIGRGRPEPIDILGADAALLSRVHNLDGAVTTDAYDGPVVGAFVTARVGDTNYFLNALAPDTPDNEKLVDDLVQTLRITK